MKDTKSKLLYIKNKTTMKKEYPELEGTINLCNDMINKKQTAVEWLEEKLKEYKYLNKNADHYFEQAKEMEKQQIINAHLLGLIYPLEIEVTKQAEQYYNETFKSEQ